MFLLPLSTAFLSATLENWKADDLVSMDGYLKGAEAHDVPSAAQAVLVESLQDRMKSTDADRYDMLRLGKEQEMKVCTGEFLSLVSHWLT